MTDDELIKAADEGGDDFVVVDGPFEGDEGTPCADIVGTAWVFGAEEVTRKDGLKFIRPGTGGPRRIVRFMDKESEQNARQLLESARNFPEHFPNQEDIEMDVDAITPIEADVILTNLYNTPVGDLIFRLQVRADQDG